MTLQLGIDEAGRGPVIGPLVMAGCITSSDIDVELKNLGVKDSKLILKNKRNILFSKVKEMVIDYEIIIVSPEEIDAALHNPDLNLNKLEAITSAKIVSSLLQRNPSLKKDVVVMLDSPTNTPLPYISYVKRLLKDDSVDVKAEIKADATYPSVSAASILAKVTRDSCIDEMHSQIKHISKDVAIGSGYPSDPLTKAFTEEFYDKLDFVEGGFFRKSWKTYQNVFKKHNGITNSSQKSLSQFK